MKQKRHVSKTIAEGITKEEAETEPRVFKNPDEITLDDLADKAWQAELHANLDGYGDIAKPVVETIRGGKWLSGNYYDYHVIERMYKDIFPGLTTERIGALIFEAHTAPLKGHGFTESELWMIMDVNNGTFVDAASADRKVYLNVDDSFVVYPRMYEEKWGVERDKIVRKIEALTEEQQSRLAYLVAAACNDCDHMEAYVQRLVAIS